MPKKRIRDRKTSSWRKEKYSLLAKGLGKCTKCKVVKELNAENFSIRADNKTGFSSWCKSCQRIKSKSTMQQRRTDPIESLVVKASKIKHLKSPKGIERKRARNAIRNHKKRSLAFIWTEQNWIDCKAFFENKCAYCLSEETLTQDHFIPLNDENCSGTVVENMVPACSKCNCKKHAKNPFEWCTSEALIRIENYFQFIKSKKLQL